MLDRHQINGKVRDLIEEHRVPGGEIPAVNIGRLTRELTAHVDATVKAALNEAEARP